MTASWAITLTSSWWRSSSIGMNSSGPVIAIPALLTRPSRSCGCSCATSSAFVMSSRIVVMSGPRSTVVSRTPAITVAPLAARKSAVVRPMPVEAPVTRIVGRPARPREYPAVLFAELAAATEDVRSLSGRKDKVERLAAALGALDRRRARGRRGLPGGRAAPARARGGLGVDEGGAAGGRGGIADGGRGRCGVRGVVGVERRGLGGRAAGGAWARCWGGPRRPSRRSCGRWCWAICGRARWRRSSATRWPRPLRCRSRSCGGR